MARKTTQQQLDERLKELRGELGLQQDRLEELDRAYSRDVGMLEGQELEDVEAAINAQRYIVRQVQDKIEAIKADKTELEGDAEAAANFKWKEVEPSVLQAIDQYHISYNVENNKYMYCMDMGRDGIINPIFRSFDGARATSAFSKMIDKYLFDANNNLQRVFITKNKTHYQETASFLYTKWSDDKVYNKAKIIAKFWLEPDFSNEPYDADFDLLFYCVGGGKQENIDHLKQWIAYKYLFPERVANTPNLDIGGKPGGNGKGRYAELCRTIFTPNCIVPAAAKELNDGFNASWELATILLFDEPGEKELESGKMKKATGGEEQRVERKGVDAYTADRNYSMLAISNNSHGVFKLSGTGTGGEDRRYSVMNTNIVMVDEIMLREACDEETAKMRTNLIAQKIKDRASVALLLGGIIRQYAVHQMDILQPLHGVDYKQRFEDQKSTMDNIFDQVLPIFLASGIISVKVLQDILYIVSDSKTKPSALTIKKRWKDYLDRSKVAYTEAKQQRVELVFNGDGNGTHQSYAFRTDNTLGIGARQFPWDRVSTTFYGKDLNRDDMLIQL
tara:strand:+ start:900 stop:2585 length:1686 start_codon:yes stop_codon:yes gene_type:complete